MRRLDGVAPRTTLPPFLLLLMIYAGVHVLMAVFMGQTSAYQLFLSSQVCGLIVFLMWWMTGTVLI